MSTLTVDPKVAAASAANDSTQQAYYANDTNGKVPPLNNGDRLTRADFERRYNLRSDIQKAELIEGVVYVAPPVSPRHGIRHGDIMAWIGFYRSATPGVWVADNVSLRLDLDNDPQPDACVWLDEREIGEIEEGKFLEVDPCFIIEVASSSAAYDLHDKKHVYRRNGVQEYLVLLAHEKECRWFFLESGEYVEGKPTEQGVYQSRVLPGLWLDCVQFWAGNLFGVLQVLQKGLDSPEHQAFIKAGN